jgi:hypothetical protein
MSVPHLAGAIIHRSDASLICKHLVQLKFIGILAGHKLEAVCESIGARAKSSFVGPARVQTKRRNVIIEGLGDSPAFVMWATAGTCLKSRTMPWCIG